METAAEGKVGARSRSHISATVQKSDRSPSRISSHWQSGKLKILTCLTAIGTRILGPSSWRHRQIAKHISNARAGGPREGAIAQQ
jgi:hypothetical protein